MSPSIPLSSTAGTAPGGPAPRPRRRRTFLLAVTAAGALVLGACSGDGGGAGGGSGEEGGGEDGEVTLRFGWWGSDTRHEQTEEVIAAFEEANPGVTVQGEPGDWSGYWDKLATQVAAGDAPDLIQMDAAYIREYAERGALLELDQVDTSAIPEDIVANGSIDDAVYGMTTGINALVYMANPDLFEETGIEMPDDTSWTWEEFGEVSRQFQQDTDYIGTTLGVQPAAIEIWLRQQGVRLTDEEGQLDFEVSHLEDFYQQHLDFLESGAYPQASILSENIGIGPDESPTGSGEAAMGTWWTNQITTLSATSGADLEPLRMPQTEGTDTGHQMYYKSSMYLSGNANTEHPEEVQAFIDFFVNSQEAGDITLSERGLPANMEVRDQVIPQLEEADQRAAEFLNEIEPELGEPMPIPPLGYSALGEILSRYETEVIFKSLTPAQAAEQAYAEMEQAVAN